MIAGCTGVLGFGPFGFFWAALLSSFVLVWLWWEASPRGAAWVGFVYGAGLFGTGVSWVYVSLHVYGQMPPWMGVLTVVALVAILSLYPALVGWIFRRFLSRHPLAGAVLGLPALWGFAEWVRSWAFSGFPWLSLGYSQVDSWLAGWAPVFGVYGVSWLSMLTVVSFIVAVKHRDRWRWGASVLIALIWLGGLGLDRVEWSKAQGDPLNVALVQGNVALRQKWSVNDRPEVMNRYLALTNNLEDQDLIVWPESALPYYIHEVDERIWRSMDRHPADFILGLLEQQSDGQEFYAFNSVVAITDSDPQVYRKTHLVPFGEYLPLRPLFEWVLDYLRIPMSDLSSWPGPDQGPLQVAGTTVGITICYEDAFPEQLIKPLPEAGLLVNVSEDAWFGDSLAPHQRMQIARMRTLETARPMLRAANTGVSAIVDHRGTVTARSNQFVPAVVKGSVQPMRGRTLYVMWGNTGIVSISVLLTLGAGLLSRRCAVRSTEPESGG